MKNVNLSDLIKLLAANVSIEDLEQPLDMKSFNELLRVSGYKIRSADNEKNIEYYNKENSFKLSFDELKKGNISMLSNVGVGITLSDISNTLSVLGYVRELNSQYVSLNESILEAKPEKSKYEVLELNILNNLKNEPVDFESIKASLLNYGEVSEEDISKINKKFEEYNFNLYSYEKGKTIDFEGNFVVSDFGEDTDPFEISKIEDLTVSNVVLPGIKYNNEIIDKPYVLVNDLPINDAGKKLVEELSLKTDSINVEGDLTVYNALNENLNNVKDSLDNAISDFSKLKASYNQIGLTDSDLSEIIGKDITELDVSIEKEDEEIKKGLNNQEKETKMQEENIEIQEVVNEENNKELQKEVTFEYSVEDYIRENIRAAGRFIKTDGLSENIVKAINKWKNSIDKEDPYAIIDKIKNDASLEVLVGADYYGNSKDERDNMLKQIIESYNIGGEISPEWLAYLNKLAKSGVAVDYITIKAEMDNMVARNNDSKNTDLAKIMVILSDNPESYKELSNLYKGSELWKATSLTNFNTNTYETADDIYKYQEDESIGKLLKTRSDIVIYIKELANQDGVELSKNQEEHIEGFASVIGSKGVDKKEINQKASVLLDEIKNIKKLPKNQRDFINYYEGKANVVSLIESKNEAVNAPLREVNSSSDIKLPVETEAPKKTIEELGGISVDADSDIAKQSLGFTGNIKESEGSVEVTDKNEKSLLKRNVEEIKDVSRVKYSRVSVNVIDTKNKRVTEIEEFLMKKKRERALKVENVSIVDEKISKVNEAEKQLSTSKEVPNERAYKTDTRNKTKLDLSMY